MFTGTRTNAFHLPSAPPALLAGVGVNPHYFVQRGIQIEYDLANENHVK
jgi:hypothetical protein